MAKWIYTQVLYGNPTVSGLVRLSIGDTFESSVTVLESTVSAAPLQSAFSGGPRVNHKLARADTKRVGA